MTDGMLALTWNNHSTTFFKTLSTVRLKERYTDVTLSCGGKFYQLHKLVLSTCSDYFEKIFEQTPCKHPVIVLRDVSCDELEALLNYMYLGSVSVAQNDLSRLIKVAELFQIKGLAVPDEPPKNSDSSSSRKTDSRDRSSNVRSSVYESSRTRPSASDSPDAPVPKRPRTNESFLGAEQVSQSASNTSQNKELSRIDERLGPKGIAEDAARGGASSSSGIQQGSSYDFQIKEEVIHEVRDSDSDDHTSVGGFDPLSNPESQGAFDPIHDESEGVPPFMPKTEPQDVPPDEQSLTQPVLGQEPYDENVLSLPGPSDAQGWYSEGDTSGGLPVSEGSIGDKSQEMLPLDVSQQQQQQMILPVNPQQDFSQEERAVKVYYCSLCPYSTDYKTNYTNHMLVHTGEKPHRCNLCQISFSRKSTLTRHLQRHTGERPFHCMQCNYRAARKSSLQSHVIRKHPNYQ